MRLLIVADNALAAEAIRREMRHASGFHVTGFVRGRSSCALAVAQEQPDVVLVDDMRDAGVTLERIAELREAAPGAKLVLLTLRMDPAWLDEARAAGIDAAVSKTAQPRSFGTLVRELVRGNVFHAFAPVPDRPTALVHGGRAGMPSLTARELEILSLTASGLPNGRIAKRLWVSEQTVKFHLSNIYRKLGVANRTQASHVAHQQGLLRPHAVTTPTRDQESVDAAA
jgi:DNA-binding NarL/FixJ family response regulator